RRRRLVVEDGGRQVVAAQVAVEQHHVGAVGAAQVDVQVGQVRVRQQQPNVEVGDGEVAVDRQAGDGGGPAADRHRAVRPAVGVDRADGEGGQRRADGPGGVDAPAGRHLAGQRGDLVRGGEQLVDDPGVGPV